MKSRLPKVLQPLAGRELIRYPVGVLRELGLGCLLLVVAPENGSSLRQLLGDGVEFVEQPQPRGTGDALAQAILLLKGRVENVLVVGADTPLVRSTTLEGMMAHHLETGAVVTFLSAVAGPLPGMGRVFRDQAGRTLRIVEEAEPEEDETGEVNGGVYCFQAGWLRENAGTLAEPSRGEAYLTDAVELAVSQGLTVETFSPQDTREVLGVNNRLELASVEAVVRERIRERWMREGVTMLDPPSTFIDADTHLGQDTVIHPNTMLLGNTRVGKGCVLGPGALIRDSVLGDECAVMFSVVEKATLGRGCTVGPYSHLRAGSHLEEDVHVGTGAEVKNSRLGRGTRMGHFSYVGDAVVGKNVNIGAGTVTCNYDGVRKNRTDIGDNVFLGSDTMLVAPVKVGKGAKTGAGAVVTHDVPCGTLVVGAPAKVVDRRETRRKGRDR